MTRKALTERRIRFLTCFFLVGLVVSGATAIPLIAEVDWLVKITHSQAFAGVVAAPTGWAQWLARVQAALRQTGAEYPFLFYGTDWLAFGHFVIAIAFIGALRDPLRNAWLFTFGMIACVLVIPYALVFGAFRGIPSWWRLIDCSFGVFGFIPLWLCKRWAGELEAEWTSDSDSLDSSKPVPGSTSVERPVW
jgi:hypothetical protein